MKMMLGDQVEELMNFLVEMDLEVEVDLVFEFKFYIF